MKSEALDLFEKINILNTGKVIYSKDNKSLDTLYKEDTYTFLEKSRLIRNIL